MRLPPRTASEHTHTHAPLPGFDAICHTPRARVHMRMRPTPEVGAMLVRLFQDYSIQSGKSCAFGLRVFARGAKLIY